MKNLGNLMKQAQEMQAKMEDLQKGGNVTLLSKEKGSSDEPNGKSDK